MLWSSRWCSCMPRSPSMPCSLCRSRLRPSMLFFSSRARWMLPSLPRVTRLSGVGQVLAAEPEVHGVVGERLERHLRRRLAGPPRRTAADLLGVGLAEHLDAAQRVVPVVRAEVPVVEGERLLEPGRVGLLGQRHQRQVVVPHVVPADDVRAVGQAVRVPVAGRAQQQHRGVHRAAGDDHDVGAERDGLEPPPSSVITRGDRAAGRVGLQPLDVGVGDHLDVLVRQRRVDADHLGVGLAR